MIRSFKNLSPNTIFVKGYEIPPKYILLIEIGVVLSPDDPEYLNY